MSESGAGASEAMPERELEKLEVQWARSKHRILKVWPNNPDQLLYTDVKKEVKTADNILDLTSEVRRSHAEAAELRKANAELTTSLITADRKIAQLQEENAELRERVGELEWLAKIAKRYVRNHREDGISVGYEYLASAVDALDVEEVSNDELRVALSQAKLKTQED